jgi:L-ascorbate metabolism protein UlaG (beta-lactamase superfamily)
MDKSRSIRLTYYGYNAFTLQATKRIIIDPGQDLHWRRLGPLIPKANWSQADLILVTHGDADHAEYVPHVARASSAPVVCGQLLAERWQREGIRVVPLAVGETVQVADVSVAGIPACHGGLTLSLFEHTFTFKPSLVGVGAIGLSFTLEECRFLNLGDTLLLEDAWWELRPDVLMVPIGGMMTMDVDDALRAVEAIEPKTVIPMHHGWDILFYHRPADVTRFADGARALGCCCFAPRPGESVELQAERQTSLS